MVQIGTYRDLWAAEVTERSPALRFLAPAAGARAGAGRRRPPRAGEGDEVDVRSNGTSVRARVSIRERIRPGAGFLIEGTRRGERERCAGELGRDHEGGGRGVTLPVAEVGFAEATWILVVKSIVIFAAVFAIAPVLTVVERKVLGRFQARYGPNRVGPFGLLQPLADAVKLITQGGLQARERGSDPVGDRPGDRHLHRRRDPGDHPVRERQGRGRLLRHRRLDRDPLLLRLRLDRLLRAAARAAGPRAPSTASWARCARRRS